MRKPQFKGEGFCRTCGTKGPISMSGLCEGCWNQAKKEQIKKNRKNREANLKAKAGNAVTSSIQERINQGERLEDIMASMGIEVPAKAISKRTSKSQGA